MFVDVLFSFQRTSCRLVLATLLVYHVCLFLSNTFLTFFETFYFVSLYRSFLTTLLSYHDCRILSNTFLFFLSSLFHLLTRDKKSTQRVRLFELERVKRIELSQSAWKAEVLPLNYTAYRFGPATSYSRTCVLPSALRSLTSVFGMGTGVTSLPSSLDH